MIPLFTEGNSFLTPDLRLNMSPDFRLGGASGVIFSWEPERKDDAVNLTFGFVNFSEFENIKDISDSKYE